MLESNQVLKYFKEKFINIIYILKDTGLFENIMRDEWKYYTKGIYQSFTIPLFFTNHFNLVITVGFPNESSISLAQKHIFFFLNKIMIDSLSWMFIHLGLHGVVGKLINSKCPKHFLQFTLLFSLNISSPIYYSSYFLPATSTREVTSLKLLCSDYGISTSETNSTNKFIN